MRFCKERIYDMYMYVALVIFTMCVGYYSLGKGFDFDLYLMQSHDGVFGLSLIKSIQENGILGIYFNNRIGAPDVSSLIDYPVIDIFMAFVVWVISLFITSTSRIMYIYYIVTFAFDAVVFAALLRKLNVKRIIIFVCSALFSFVPFHFFRGVKHSTLINYMFFAIAVYLSLYILGFWENEKKWKIIILVIILGLSYGYYYAFGLIIMSIAILIRFCKERNLKNIFYYIWPPILTLVTIFATLLPKIIYANLYDANEEVGLRAFYEQEIYGLKIIQLLFPPSYSRIPIFNELSTDYSSQAPLVNENSWAALGMVAGIGFIILCGCFIYSFVAKDKCNTKEWELIDYMSLSTVALVLVGAVGGFGEIFNYFITSQIRCYNRSSIFIAGFSLIMIAILLNKINFRSKWFVRVICMLVLCLSMYDTVNVSSADWQNELKPVQACYEEFFAECEEVLDNNAMVYQLPYYDFPENGDFDYKHFVGYLFTDNLRWSYGGVKGRDVGAKQLLDSNGQSYKFIKNIKEAGFEAVYIDVSGYEDGGRTVLDFYNSLGINPIVSSDGSLYLFDIRNIELSDVKCQAGYLFVEKWNQAYEMGLTESEIANLASEIGEYNNDVYSQLYDTIEESEFVLSTTDDEYVDFLYTTILGREAAIDEQASWVDMLAKGTSREKLFNLLLDSGEFRNAQGYSEVE